MSNYCPDALALMQKVVDQASQELKLSTVSEREELALRVLNHARDGERDFETLLASAKGCPLKVR